MQNHDPHSDTQDTRTRRPGAPWCRLFALRLPTLLPGCCRAGGAGGAGLDDVVPGAMGLGARPVTAALARARDAAGFCLRGDHRVPDDGGEGVDRSGHTARMASCCIGAALAERQNCRRDGALRGFRRARYPVVAHRCPGADPSAAARRQYPQSATGRPAAPARRGQRDLSPVGSGAAGSGTDACAARGPGGDCDGRMCDGRARDSGLQHERHPGPANHSPALAGALGAGADRPGPAALGVCRTRLDRFADTGPGRSGSCLAPMALETPADKAAPDFVDSSSVLRLDTGRTGLAGAGADPSACGVTGPARPGRGYHRRPDHRHDHANRPGPHRTHLAGGAR